MYVRQFSGFVVQKGRISIPPRFVATFCFCESGLLIPTTNAGDLHTAGGKLLKAGSQAQSSVLFKEREDSYTWDIAFAALMNELKS
jgi:hypothetical protein